MTQIHQDVDWTTMSDEDIVLAVQNDTADALDFLINKYRQFVRGKAHTYFLVGGDQEDIIQEGMIGLYKAIRDYRGDKQSSFRSFAELCIKRQIITAIKTATRQKHSPLNTYVSLDRPIYDEESERTLMDIIEEQSISDPEVILLKQERFGHMQQQVSETLSELEQRVLFMYLDGQSYAEISEALGRRVKSIDNALQRVKRKCSPELFVDERLSL